ncbi:MAG: YihY/virulence factor BrkB family protein [Planctomycetes bacterium]|nr:YihY/virulence factor BrkB family protein [Planctomycetota bacterium]
MKLAAAATLLVDSARELRRHDGMRMAAALAYYAALALAPLLLITLSLTGLVVDRTRILESVSGEMEQVLGRGAAELLRSVATERADGQRGALASLLGIGTLLFGATGVFIELQDDLNTLWNAPPRKRATLLSFVRHRLASLAMVASIGFLLLVSFLASSLLSLLSGPLGELSGEQALVGRIFHSVVALAGDALFFALLFKVLPDVRIRWRDVWIGALLTAGLFIVGQFAIGQYLGRAAIGSAYGAAGSLVLVLVWVYYSSLIVLYGAELTQRIAARHGRGGAEPPRV